jgi:hypothetical protein
MSPGIHPVTAVADFKHSFQVAQCEAWAEVVEQTNHHMEPVPVNVDSCAIARVLPLAIHKDVMFASNTPLEDPAKLGEGYATSRDRCTKIEKPSASYRESNCGVESLDPCTLEIMKVQGLACCNSGSEPCVDAHFEGYLPIAWAAVTNRCACARLLGPDLNRYGERRKLRWRASSGSTVKSTTPTW